MSLRKKLFLYSFFGFIFSVLPLFIYVASHLDRYVGTPTQSIRLTAGGVLAMILLLLKSFEAIKMPNRVTTVIIIMVFSYLLESILSELSILCAAYLVGELLNAIFFSRKAKIIRHQIEVEKQADATADRVEEMIKNYVGNGRT